MLPSQLLVLTMSISLVSFMERVRIAVEMSMGRILKMLYFIQLQLYHFDLWIYIKEFVFLKV